MSQHTAKIIWQRDNQAFIDGKYSRAHDWVFDGGEVIPASASPSVVPLPFSLAENVDPEEAFVASIASCHMLFFLSFAAKADLLINEYRDNPVGYLETNQENKLAITRVILQPTIGFDAQAAPDKTLLDSLHQQAHSACFIANSVNTRIEIKSI